MAESTHDIPLRPGLEVSPADVKQMLDNDEPIVLIDCRRPNEYEFARIDGAKLFTLEKLPELLPDLEDYADERVIIYCHHGVRSLQMTSILRQQGFADVKSMAGGIDLWSQMIDPNVPRY